MLRQPTNEAAQRKVAEAVAKIGLAEYPRPDGHIEVLPAVGEELEAAVTDESEPGDPAQHLVTELQGALQELVGRLERERRERIDDLALSTDLFIEGWRSVDRRLGRLEKMIERIDQRQQFDQRHSAGAEVHRLDDRRGSNRT
jgi:hypothetical protein